MPFLGLLAIHPKSRCSNRQSISEASPPLCTTTSYPAIHLQHTHYRFSAFSDTHGNQKHDLPPNAASHHLDDELRAKGITHVYCVGTAGDACVPHTAWDAADFGFKGVVLEDVVANLQDDGGKEFEECKKKSLEKGIEYGRMEGEQVERVRQLGRE